MIRVAFVIDFSPEGWMGGIHYYWNLLDALDQLPHRRIEPVLFVGSKVDLGKFYEFPPVEIIPSEFLDEAGFLPFLRSGYRRLLSSEIFLERLLEKYRIDVLSHAGFLGKGARIRTLGWIPDFQHRHLPKFFSETERRSRDHHFRLRCRRCTSILVSSYNAREDLADLFPDCLARSRVLQFVAGIHRSDSFTPIDRLRRRYEFEGPYFFVPNQFWAHKNHQIILEALRLLRGEGKRVLVFATGNTRDHRQPEHVNALMSQVKMHQLEDQFRVLGLISREDVMGLMRECLAVLNPSLFEGWSTTVEEGKSMGKKVVLSDIPVHREQDPPCGIFFDPGNPRALADALWQVWTSRDTGEEAIWMKEAASLLPERRRRFAERYEEIVMEVMGSGRGK